MSATTRSLSTVLVANRGEIAIRIFSTAHDLGMRTVAVFSDADRDSLHVHAADVAVPIGGTGASDSYLVIGKIIEAARRSGADTIHPGYGFLAENADFAQAVIDAGLTWVGPPPEAIRAMGLKIQAKELAREVGLPVLASAVVEGDDPAVWARQAGEVGYPLIVKASAGGGGKGMRLLHDPADLGAAVEGARREALSSFGDPTVFLERYLEAPRHVEVQVLADSHGNVVDLFERECSIQRRHQKIVEEAPSPAVTAGLRADMGDAAVALARRIGYVGAGTVEYLVSGSQFFFLEMNTRLQVEHRVTEEICDVDLVRLQFEIAMGRPLPLDELPEEPDGHAIEVRLYAEDPAAEFMPSTGTIHRFVFPEMEDLLLDEAVEDGSVVTPYYDPMIAKVVVWRRSREEAAAVLARVLDHAMCLGVTTNRAMLAATLRHSAFLAGDTCTDFLEQHPELLSSGPTEEDLRRHAVVAALHAARTRQQAAKALAFAPSGWRNVRSQPQSVTYSEGIRSIRVDYVVAGGHSDVEVSVDETTTPPAQARIDWLDSDERIARCELEMDGLRTYHRIVVVGETSYVWSERAQTALVEQPRFVVHDAEATGGGPTAPLPGTVVAVPVKPGEAVLAGQTLVVVEAMKMEHKITAPVDAVVSAVRVGVGDSVEAHQVLVDLDEAPPEEHP